jgi:hypothetical protein
MLLQQQKARLLVRFFKSIKSQEDLKNLLHMNIIIEENEQTYTFSI